MLYDRVSEQAAAERVGYRVWAGNSMSGHWSIREMLLSDA